MLSRAEVEALFALSFNDLIFKAHQVHRDNFAPNRIQVSTLLSIKTGGCTEDCAYCSQSRKSSSEITPENLKPIDEVVKAAQAAKDGGASRFCMGAAWRGPKERDMPPVLEMVRRVKALGLETCLTLGFVDDEQIAQLKAAGLDYYNHNIDTSEEHYAKIVTTHSFEDRLKTMKKVKEAGIKLCSGGILGLGETREDRVNMLLALAADPPDSVPLNKLVPIAGTRLEGQAPFDHIEFVRTIAVARILMPKSYIRLSAGREAMKEEMQALCFFAGANSIFAGDKLLTTPGASKDADDQLFVKLGLQKE